MKKNLRHDFEFSKQARAFADHQQTPSQRIFLFLATFCAASIAITSPLKADEISQNPAPPVAAAFSGTNLNVVTNGPDKELCYQTKPGVSFLEDPLDGSVKPTEIHDCAKVPATAPGFRSAVSMPGSGPSDKSALVFGEYLVGIGPDDKNCVYPHSLALVDDQGNITRQFLVLQQTPYTTEDGYSCNDSQGGQIIQKLQYTDASNVLVSAIDHRYALLRISSKSIVMVSEFPNDKILEFGDPKNTRTPAIYIVPVNTVPFMDNDTGPTWYARLTKTLQGKNPGVPLVRYAFTPLNRQMKGPQNAFH